VGVLPNSPAIGPYLYLIFQSTTLRSTIVRLDIGFLILFN